MNDEQLSKLNDIRDALSVAQSLMRAYDFYHGHQHALDSRLVMANHRKAVRRALVHIKNLLESPQ